MHGLEFNNKWNVAGRITVGVLLEQHCDKTAELYEQVSLQIAPDVGENSIFLYNSKNERVGTLDSSCNQDFYNAIKSGQFMFIGCLKKGVDEQIVLVLDVYSKHRITDETTDDSFDGILHNNLVMLHNTINQYSYNALNDYLSFLDRAIHNISTSFDNFILYSILCHEKLLHCADIRNKAITTLVNYLKKLHLGKALGSKQLSFFPVFPEPVKEKHDYTNKHLPDAIVLTPENIFKHYQYPSGAVGLIVFSENELRFEIYKTPARTELKWLELFDMERDCYRDACVFNASDQLDKLIQVYTENEFNVRGDWECFYYIDFKSEPGAVTVFNLDWSFEYLSIMKHALS